MVLHIKQLARLWAAQPFICETTNEKLPSPSAQGLGCREQKAGNSEHKMPRSPDKALQHTNERDQFML